MAARNLMLAFWIRLSEPEKHDPMMVIDFTNLNFVVLF